MRLGELLARTQAKDTLPENDDQHDSDVIIEHKTAYTATPERSTSSRVNTNTPTSRPSVPAPNRFSWFAPKVAAAASAISSFVSDDPLLSLTVDAALFPDGRPGVVDTTHFNHLYKNAADTITRLESAYRAQCQMLRSARADSEADAEEVQEATTRTRHLKAQLENMASRANEQDRAMQALADQLAAERSGRAEDLHKMLQLQKTVAKYESVQLRRQSVVSAETDTSAETAQDDQTPRRQSTVVKRTADGASDSGFESGKDDFDDNASGVGREPQSSSTRRSSSVKTQRHAYRTYKVGTTESFAGAWSVIASLRQENRLLQSRVQDLEATLEGCLSIVQQAVLV